MAVQTIASSGPRVRAARVWNGLVAVHDRIFSEANKSRLKRSAIRVSIVAFLLHLLLIFLARSMQHPPPLIAESGQNYLSAISTPFSIILFYEVLTLIAALPASTTRSIANQFEIVSLIYIRDVFADIGRTSALGLQHRLTREALPVFLDMWAGLLMYLLVGVFQFVAARRVRPVTTEERSLGLASFITQKKVVAIGLSTLLLGMATYNFFLFAWGIARALRDGQVAVQLATTFYNDLFTVMIFTDVLILILSLVVSGQYEMVFRNAAFVVSIILIRFSLTQGHELGAPLALLAMLFGICTLIVFNFHMRLQNSGD